MARIVYETRLKELNALTPTLRELKVEIVNPPEMKFQAGQFVMLHVPQEGEKPALRAYSLASSDKNSKSFSLLIKMLGEGVSSQYIKNLKVGEKLQFTGPFGKLFFKEPAAPQVLMLCTGAGLSQHHSFLASHAAKFPKTEFHLLIGVWNEGEMFYQKELDVLKKELKNFKYDFVLDKPTGQWKGLTGFVTDHLKNYDYVSTETDIYLCGNPHMIKSVKQVLADQAFSEDHIFAESFG